MTVVGDLDGFFGNGGVAYGPGLREAVDVCRCYAEVMTPGKYPYGSAFQLSGGGHVSFARESSGVPLVRVDINPNKLEAAVPVRRVLGLMCDTRCTRLDVAVDYLGHRVGEWVPVGRSGKRFTVAARNGAVETQMLGARSSARQLVVYDKAADCKAKKEELPWDWTGDVMRVEARQRLKPADGSSVLSPGMMDDVSLIGRGAEWSSVLAIADRAMLEYLGRHPDEWSALSRSQRRRLDTFKDSSGVTLDPSAGEVYRAGLSDLRERYFDTLCGVL
jgi:hypothetical protein